jgi:hypothetical protein
MGDLDRQKTENNNYRLLLRLPLGALSSGIWCFVVSVVWLPSQGAVLARRHYQGLGLF